MPRPLAINIKEGDKLHFEMSMTHADNTGRIWRNQVYWDPIVAYNSYSYVLPSYQASDYYVESTDANPNGPWQWDYYSISKETYTKLQYKSGFTHFDDKTVSPVPAEETTTGAFANWSNTGAAVSKYWMRGCPDDNYKELCLSVTAPTPRYGRKATGRE